MFYQDTSPLSDEHFFNILPMPDFEALSETAPAEEEIAADDPSLEGIPILEDLLDPDFLRSLDETL